MRRQASTILLTMTLMGCGNSLGTASPETSVPTATPTAPARTPATPTVSPAAQTPAPPTASCMSGQSQSTCDDAVRVALAAVASSDWTPTYVWIDSGQFCPTQDCLFDPGQNFPYPNPPSGGQWVANAEIAFAGRDQHAGLNIADVTGTLVPVLIGYRVPLLTWCSGGCPSSSSIDGNYKLELVLPHLAWKVGDPISGSADLGLTDSLPAKVAGASELIAFAFDEVGGNRHVAPSWLESCVVYPLDPASPTNVALYKSGGFIGNEPDVDFLRSFFADPQIHLPAGAWDITAIAAFSEGGCSGANHTLKATVRIQVAG